MPKPLKILMAEDNPADAEMVLRELRRAGYAPDCRRVQTEADFSAGLRPDLDVILSDYGMPTFSGLRALQVLKERKLDIPFIIISGTIGEEVAVDVMKHGATDYLLKDRLVRLGIAVEQALEQGRLREERKRAEEELQRSEQDLRELAEELDRERSRLASAQAVAKLGSWDMDLSTMRMIWSAETYRIFETTAREFQPMHEDFLRLVHPEDRETVEGAFRRSLDQRGVSSIEHRLLLADGRVKYLEEHWRISHDDGGRALRALGTCRDITERKLAEDELRRKTALLEAQVNSTLDGIIVVDKGGHKILQNHRIAQIFKIPPPIVEDKDDRAQLEWVTGMTQDPEAFLEKVTHLYAHPDEVSQDEILLKDGTVLDRYSSPVIGKEGEYYGRTWVFRDVTDRMRDANALLQSKRFLQSTLNALTSHIAILDEEGTIIEVNTAWNRFARENDFRGTHRGVGNNYLKLCDEAHGIFAEESGLVAAGIRAVMAGLRHDYELEYPYDGPAGRHWFVVRVTRFEGDGPLRIVVAHENISERKEAEGATRTSEERFRQLAENIQEVFWISDPTRHELLYVSPAYEEIWGRSCDSLKTSPLEWFEAIHPEDRDRVLHAAMTKQMHGHYNEDYRIIRPDGSVRWVNDRAFPVREADGWVRRIVGIAKDITESRQVAEHMREQASLLDRARDAIVVRDLEKGITYWNRSAEQIYGWTSEEVMGRVNVDFLYQDMKAYRRAVDLVLSTGEWSGEIQQTTKSGKPVLIDARWTLLRDGAGRPQSILAINTDITEKKNLEQQYLRSQRVESIGTLAGGIAHDLNNVLAPIMMSIDLLSLTNRDPRVAGVLKTIDTSVKRGADMVKQILSFARGVEGERVMINPCQIIADMQHLVQDTFPKNIVFEAALPAVPCSFTGDHTQIHQVLLNLCVNARDAMPTGGTLTVSADTLEVDANYAAMHPEAKPGPYVVIKVSDTGTGIPPEVLDRIFDPFFTTKERGKGTGLGLSTTLTIVRSHGGYLNVDTEPGRGTTFTLCLPASTGEQETEAAPQADMHPRGNGELVLVVDDEAAVRTITEQTLEAYGYRVLVASDGTQAVALYAQHQDSVAAVLTDMMMPIMDGPATIQVLKRMNPAAKIIAASGYTAHGEAARAEGMGVHYFLPKPYTAQTILKTLHDILQPEAAARTSTSGGEEVGMEDRNAA